MATSASSSSTVTGELVDRISPQQTHRHLESSTAVLVCAYDSAEKCRNYHLDGAIPLAEFESRMQSIPKDKELIFYCA
jgi:rhodanese-related sulfurtransferase